MFHNTLMPYVERRNINMENMSDFQQFLKTEIKELYVAFIDILGYKDKIKRCVDLHDVGILNCILNKNKKDAKRDLIIFYFSDCMYIIGNDINKILELIAFIQIQLLDASEIQITAEKQSYKDINLVRGGITKGEILVNEQLNILLGSAVNKAYELESMEAKYPRIILDTAISWDNVLEQYIKKDRDGVMYFDFIQYLQKHENYKFDKKKKQRFIEFIQEYKKKSKDDKIKEKYRWFEKYLDSVCAY